MIVEANVTVVAVTAHIKAWASTTPIIPNPPTTAVGTTANNQPNISHTLGAKSGQSHFRLAIHPPDTKNQPEKVRALQPIQNVRQGDNRDLL